MAPSRYLLLIGFLSLPFCLAHAQQSVSMTGCLSQDAAGALHLEASPSRRMFRLSGDIAQLQRHINQRLSASGHVSQSPSEPSFTVVQFGVISDTCTSELPFNGKFPVPGKVGQVQVSTPVTSAATADQTTAGFQTEVGLEQAERASPVASQQNRSTPFGPSDPEQAGQNEFSSDIAAQAASRAELYPGTTLGVDIKTAPPSSIRAAQSTRTFAVTSNPK